MVRSFSIGSLCLGTVVIGASLFFLSVIGDWSASWQIVSLFYVAIGLVSRQLVSTRAARARLVPRSVS